MVLLELSIITGLVCSLASLDTVGQTEKSQTNQVVITVKIRPDAVGLTFTLQ